MSNTGYRTSVGIHFLEPAWNDQELGTLQAVGSITEPIEFAMLDGINEQGIWSATTRLDDIQVRGGEGFKQPSALDPSLQPIVIAAWEFDGPNFKEPTFVHPTTVGYEIDFPPAFNGSFTQESPGYATDPVATVIPGTGDTGQGPRSFNVRIKTSTSIKLLAMKMRVSRTDSATPAGFSVGANYNNFKKLPLLTTGPLAGSSVPSETVPTERTDFTNYSIDLTDVPPQRDDIILRVTVDSPNRTTEGLDFDNIEIFAASFNRPLVGQMVRIYVGTVDASTNFTSVIPKDDVFYGIVESYTYSGVDSNSLQPLLEIRGKGLRSVFEHMIVAPPANNPRATSRVFTSQNPGQIWNTLRIEANERGLNRWPFPSFTVSTDSSGAAWSETINLSVQVGSTMDDVLRSFSELGYEVVMRKDRLAIYDGLAGSGSPTDPVATLSDHDAQDQEHFGPIRTVAYVRGSNGVVTEQRAPQQLTAIGRRETYIESQRADSGLLANAALARLQDEAIKNSISYRYIRPVFSDDFPGEVYVAPAPYKSYQLGDYLRVNSLAATQSITRRVISIALTLTPEGELRVTPELGDIRDDLDRRTQKLISKLQSGTGEGTSVEFRDTVGSVAGVQPVVQVAGATGVEGALLGLSIQTVDQVASYDSGTNLIQTVGGLTVANYTGGSVSPSDGIYIVNGEAAVGKLP